MPKVLSCDLRDRVVAALKAGSSCAAAAERFGVSAMSAWRWGKLADRQGDTRPGPVGGDMRSRRIEAVHDEVMALYRSKADMTLYELQAALAERGHLFGYGTLWRFFERHKITLKKRPDTRLSRSART